ncbi:MAG TPA: hypothetical protein VGA99_06920 [bacterium]
MKRTIFIAGAACLLLAACAKKGAYVNPSYENKDIVATTLVLAPLTAEPQINYPEEIKQDLLRDFPQDLYAAFIRTGLPQSLKTQSQFKEAGSDAFKGSPLLQPRIFNLTNDQLLSVSLPVAPGIEFDSLRADFVLFLENVTLSLGRDRVEDSDPRKTYKVAGGTDETDATFQSVRGYRFNLLHTSYYVFYDNHTGKVAAYGVAQTETPVTNESVEFIFKHSMDDLAGAILKNTPFNK